MIKISDFKPAWWLPSGHLQTLWPNFGLLRVKLPLQRERVELADGDFIDLDWMPQAVGPIVLVMYGVSGDAKSPYVKATLRAIADANWQGVLMHFRGNSGEVNRLPRSYHAGETTDLQYIINSLQQRYPHRKLAVIGFSLGGNMLLKWLGETGSTNPLTTAVGVSVPFKLNNAATKLNRGLARFYQWYLIKKLRVSILYKAKKMQLPFSNKIIKKAKSFFEYDDKITAPLHGFKNVEEYYRLSSCHAYLKHIGIPTLILHALDDPLMTPEIIPHENDLSQQVTLELTQAGGHVGFIAGPPWKPYYWYTQRIVDYLKGYL